MGRALDLSWFVYKFSKGMDFEVSEGLYEEKIGKPLPGTNYIRYRSPIAKLAKDNGYSVGVIEKPVVQRTIVFRRKGEEK